MAQMTDWAAVRLGGSCVVMENVSERGSENQ